MATRKRRTGAPRKRASSGFASRVRSGSRRVYSRAKSEFMSGKIRWGEAALAAIVGYEGDNIIMPVTRAIYDATPSDSRASAFMTAFAAPYPNFATAVNKGLGTIAIAKVAYDAVKNKHLDQNDLSLYIPYAIGTVFDAPGGSGKSGSEVW